MSSVAALHPQVVHFVVALIVVAVGLRFAALWRPAMAWLGPAAATLVGLGTLAALVAVWTGGAARGPVEAVPGVYEAVERHAQWGERARNILLVLVAAEVAAAVLAARRHARARTAAVVSAAVGAIALLVLVRAGDLGGQLVYGYGGGVGIRSGDPADVQRAFITAAYQQALQDRAGGRPLDAARTMEVAAVRFPDHVELQLAQIESMIVDRAEPQAALNRLTALGVPGAEPRLRIRAGLLRAQALQAMGDLSAAGQVLETLRTEFPADPRVLRQLEEIAGR